MQLRLCPLEKVPSLVDYFVKVYELWNGVISNDLNYSSLQAQTCCVCWSNLQLALHFLSKFQDASTLETWNLNRKHLPVEPHKAVAENSKIGEVAWSVDDGMRLECRCLIEWHSTSWSNLLFIVLSLYVCMYLSIFLSFYLSIYRSIYRSTGRI